MFFQLSFQHTFAVLNITKNPNHEGANNINTEIALLKGTQLEIKSSYYSDNQPMQILSDGITVSKHFNSIFSPIFFFSGSRKGLISGSRLCGPKGPQISKTTQDLARPNGAPVRQGVTRPQLTLAGKMSYISGARGTSSSSRRSKPM